MSANFGYLTPGIDNLNGTYMPFFDPYAANYANPQTGNLVGSAPDPTNPNPTTSYPTEGGKSNIDPTTGNVASTPSTVAPVAAPLVAQSAPAAATPTRTATPDESAGLTTPTAGPGSGALPTGILPAGQTVGGAPPMAGAGAVGSTTSGAAPAPFDPASYTAGAGGVPNLVQALQAYLANPYDPATLAGLHTAVTSSQQPPGVLPPPAGSSPQSINAYYKQIGTDAMARTGYVAPPPPQTNPDGSIVTPSPSADHESNTPYLGYGVTPKSPPQVPQGAGEPHGSPQLGTSGGLASRPPSVTTSPIVTQPTPGAQTTAPAFLPRPAYPIAPTVTQAPPTPVH